MKGNRNSVERYDGDGLVDSNIRRRYSDKRTEEGKRLAAVHKALVASVGGPEGMSSAQALILGALEAKLVVLWQISDHIDCLKSGVVEKDSGKLVSCLATPYPNAGREQRPQGVL
jgi:hypothetical protein